jgi:hypothetical protein
MTLEIKIIFPVHGGLSSDLPPLSPLQLSTILTFSLTLFQFLKANGWQRLVFCRKKKGKVIERPPVSW